MMSFYDRVYELLTNIPAGRVVSYGQIALMLNSPRSARAVGYALRACKDPSLPCHRVLRADGSLTCGFAPGVQRALLEAEGVGFTGDGRADLSRFRWDGQETGV